VAQKEKYFVISYGDSGQSDVIDPCSSVEEVIVKYVVEGEIDPKVRHILKGKEMKLSPKKITVTEWGLKDKGG
jgi:hypothetical protein